MNRAETAYCTLTTKSHLARARVLAQTIREQEPDSELYVLLADRIDGDFDPASEPFRIIQLEELDQQDELMSMAFYYRQNEFCWALKPRLHEHMYTRLGFSKWVFLDVDMAVYHPLGEVVRPLESTSILLSPHLIHPSPLFSSKGRSIAKLESYLLHTGTLNGGFVGLRAGEETTRFLEWWKDRLRLFAFDRRPAQFGDQYWLMLVPGFFDSVRVLRHPGANVAYWNVFERTVTRDREGKVFIDGEPLIFFHFAGFDVSDPGRVSGYAIPQGLDDYPEIVRELARDYHRRLLANGQREVEGLSYGFGRFDSGEPVTPAMRALYFRELKNGKWRLPGSPFANQAYFRRREGVQAFRMALRGAARGAVRRLRKALNPETDFEVAPWK